MRTIRYGQHGRFSRRREQSTCKTSNLNFNPNDTVANLVVVRLSTASDCAVAAGHVDIYNSAGSTQIIVDVFGYFTAA